MKQTRKQDWSHQLRYTEVENSNNWRTPRQRQMKNMSFSVSHKENTAGFLHSLNHRHSPHPVETKKKHPRDQNQETATFILIPQTHCSHSTPLVSTTHAQQRRHLEIVVTYSKACSTRTETYKKSDVFIVFGVFAVVTTFIFGCK